MSKRKYNFKDELDIEYTDDDILDLDEEAPVDIVKEIFNSMGFEVTDEHNDD